MFGGSADQSNENSLGANGASSSRQDDEQSLISETTQGVFSKGAEMMDNLESTGPDYTIAAGFLFFSLLFFLAAVTSLPMLLLSPRSFNLYFSFGSIFLQCALAFYYGPVKYVKSLFEAENRLVSTIYIGSLLVSLYFIWSGTSYIGALCVIALQGFALSYFVMKAWGGADRANSWAYNMIFASVLNRLRSGGAKSQGYSDLPI